MVKEMCTSNSLPCLWEAFGVKMIMTDRLYMTLAVDHEVLVKHLYSDSLITYLHTLAKGT